jgi:hypothetical protein
MLTKNISINMRNSIGILLLKILFRNASFVHSKGEAILPVLNQHNLNA